MSTAAGQGSVSCDGHAAAHAGQTTGRSGHIGPQPSAIPCQTRGPG